MAEKMKVASIYRGFDLLSLGVGVLIGCFLVSLTYVTVYKSDMLAFPSATMASPMSKADVYSWISQQIDSKSKPRCNHGSAASYLCENSETIETARVSSSAGSEIPSQRNEFSASETTRDGKVQDTKLPCEPDSVGCTINNGSKDAFSPPTSIDVRRSSQVPVASSAWKSDPAELDSKPMCDTSSHRCDLCDIHGDIRIITGKDSPSVLRVTDSSSANHQSWQVKPYARKWDHGVMGFTKPVTVRSTADRAATPRCDVNHTVPAVVFSMGGYVGNHFHDFTDVLVPVFQTVRQFDGEVQLVVARLNRWWMNAKYGRYFRRLSRYDVIDLDNDARVHCFERAIVGLRADADLMIDPAKSPMGYTMSDFRRFMRSIYGLNRDYALKLAEQTEKKPRLLMIARSGSRKFMNADHIVKLAEKLGFEVVVSEGALDLTEFSQTVNSCDVMLGVHGAGLTNMVFLPTNAVVIQVVPFGGHEWIAGTYFGNPATGMELNYLEYTITADESTLTELYPRDDPVFTDPKSIHKLGWVKMGEIYLDKQNVRLDLNRFRPVLEKALDLLRK
ncbi:beta-1,2-xylosyltransferase XYXT1-like [Curcuma longa]|uniref:beta-1,2-xylosyltransferase XYXT1-like n=1 Tax=Curcuma longa TaxID=136217 RepID=UPI003D9E4915